MHNNLILNFILSACTIASMLAMPLSETVFNPCQMIAVAESDGVFTYSVQGDTVLITGFDETMTEIVIPDTIKGLPVTQLSEKMFSDCTELESVTLPKYLTAIPDFGFVNCPSLISVHIPEGVTSIGMRAFTNCPNLKDLILPSTLETIGSCAFWGCTSLTEITVPKKVVKLEESFIECTDLTKIILPETIEILDQCFYGCTGLNEISIPDTVSQMNDSFNNCTGLTEITIPETVHQLKNAFNDCTSLISIHIPPSLSNLTSSFYGCSSLEAIYVNSESKTYSSVDGVLFSKDGSKLLLYPSAKENTEYVVPDNVTEIADGAFHSAKNLTYITLPLNMSSIGAGAFSDCSSLKQLTIPEGVKELYSTVSGCDSLESLSLPKSLTKINRGTINCKNLTNIYYNGSVEDWSKVIIGKNNESLYQAKMNFSAEDTAEHQNATLYTAPSVLPVPEENVSYQIKNINPDVTFSVIAGNAAEVSKTGLVTPTKKYGETIIQITDGDNISFLHVTTEDYTLIYADMTITEFLNENITEDMTDPEKLNIIGKLPASMDYSSYPDSYVDMIAYHTGNCIGSATMLEEMCRRLGIKAWVRNANRDPNAGSAHVNALAEVDGVYYELEAGYSGTAPRAYKVTKRTSLYKYKDTTDGIDVYQYDGIDENDTALQIPDSIDGKSVTRIGDSFLKENPWVISVTVPDTVKEISDSAFSDFQGTLIGKRDSVAAKFAATHRIAFQAVDSLIAGDVNGDQVVNILDVIAVNKYLLGCKKLEEWQEKAADVDKNGFVEANDSLNILKFALDVIMNFEEVVKISDRV